MSPQTVLVVGLGNFTFPNTRHSVGQLLLGSFAARLGITLREDKSTLSYVGQKQVAFQRPAQRISKRLAETVVPESPLLVNVVLLKPKLYMNLSGKAIALGYKSFIPKTSKPDAALPHVFVLHDSLSHKPLSLSARLGGSANGHNGVASAISHLHSPNFHRMRLGIGRPAGGARYDGYVLEKLDADEISYWGECGVGVDKAWEAFEKLVLETVTPSKTTT